MLPPSRMAASTAHRSVDLDGPDGLGDHHQGLALADDIPAIRALDLFAGVGGSSSGAHSAGIKVVAAVDYWSLARDTYMANFPDVVFLQKRCEDVRIDELKAAIGEIDLLIASPECTSHTCAKGSAPRSETSRRTCLQAILSLL
jgi:site-specific DNA-cytosine methylase